nr:protein kinase-like domain, concanavalin A-like lectin/glucanase domain protein [Tanacetum cinerariifolium]
MLDDTSTRDTARDSMAHVNAASTDQIKKEELQSKGIKIPSKLLSPKYLSQASLEEQNRNPSSPKRVYFVNSVFIIRKEDEVREKENVKPNATKYNDHEMTAKAEEKIEEDCEAEFKEEIEEEEENVEYFDSFPQLRKIMSGRLEPRTKPSNPMKICNFVGRVRGLKVFVDHSTYECDFIILEDTTSIIDHDLGLVVFGKPFVEKTRLIYDNKEGTIAFEDNNDKLIFKMPHKMEMFKNVDFTGVSTDRIPPFIIGGNDDDNEKPHYSDSLNLGPEYNYDESVIFDEKKLGSS